MSVTGRNRKSLPTPAADSREAVGLLLQDELRTLHTHVTHGTEWEVMLVGLCYSKRTGLGVNVRKANVRKVGIAVEMVRELRAAADELENSIRRKIDDESDTA